MSFNGIQDLTIDDSTNNTLLITGTTSSSINTSTYTIITNNTSTAPSVAVTFEDSNVFYKFTGSNKEVLLNTGTSNGQLVTVTVLSPTTGNALFYANSTINDQDSQINLDLTTQSPYFTIIWSEPDTTWYLVSTNGVLESL